MLSQHFYLQFEPKRVAFWFKLQIAKKSSRDRKGDFYVEFNFLSENGNQNVVGQLLTELSPFFTPPPYFLCNLSFFYILAAILQILTGVWIHFIYVLVTLFSPLKKFRVTLTVA